ncbi:MAG: S4 domain-containing protein [Candidatus Pacebacteria bacterium]|nr:S4 domain-containing protein [Candidatus Paceibacterota bacterium]
MANYLRHKPGSRIPKGFKEKERLRKEYNISERELKRYAKETITSSENPRKDLFKKLETRLDNIVFRLGFVKDRENAARLIKSGHVTVNEIKRDDPFFHLQQRDVIEFAGNGHYSKQTKFSIVPPWLERKDRMGRVIRLPSLRDSEKRFNLERVIEYYALV